MYSLTVYKTLLTNNQCQSVPLHKTSSKDQCGQTGDQMMNERNAPAFCIPISFKSSGSRFFIVSISSYPARSKAAAYSANFIFLNQSLTSSITGHSKSKNQEVDEATSHYKSSFRQLAMRTVRLRHMTRPNSVMTLSMANTCVLRLLCLLLLYGSQETVNEIIDKDLSSLVTGTNDGLDLETVRKKLPPGNLTSSSVNFSPMEVKTALNSLVDTSPLLSLSKTLKASRISLAASTSLWCFCIKP